MLPIFCFIIFAVVFMTIAAARRKAAAEQQNQQRMFEQDKAQARTDAPVRPVSRVQNTRTVPQNSVQEVKAKSIPRDEHLQTAQPDSSQTEQKSILSFSGNEAVKGILYAEVLGKPKSLR